jgi:dolichol-phosphate mannosyltransferase
LQDPPEIIPEMVKAWKAGHEVVLGQRQDRSVDTFFKRASAKMFYKLMGKLTKSQFPPNVGDFRLVAGPALDALKELREQSPYWRGLVIWAGFKTTTVKYDRASRFAGESKYPLHKMVKLALDAVFSFSKEPLMLISLAGIATSVLSVLFILTHFVLMAAGISLVPGWMSLIALVGFLGGFQLICLGVLGQYVGRIYEQVLERPQVLYNQPEQINSNETFKKAS